MNDSFDKGAAVEEWIDRRFFRPLGLHVARALSDTRVTADQVTLVSLAIGLVAGRLCFYPSVALNALGVVLFIVSDIFDSADGQLARMRGTSTRFGRILDGISDNFRFINLYLQLMARCILAGSDWWVVVALGVCAGIAHAMQSTAADFVRQAYLELAEGRGELDLIEDADKLPATGVWQRWYVRSYRSYLRRQQWLFPATTTFIRSLRDSGSEAGLRENWQREQSGVVRGAALIGQNIRFLLIALTVVPGWPLYFFWVTIFALGPVMAALVSVHERRARGQFPLSSGTLATAS